MMYHCYIKNDTELIQKTNLFQALLNSSCVKIQLNMVP